MPPPHDQRTFTLRFAEADADRILSDLDDRLGHSVSEELRDLYRRLRQARSDALRQEIPQQRAASEGDVIYTPPQQVRPLPERSPRLGRIVRKVDVTGISGVGHIGEICVFSDGFTVIRWFGGPPQNQPKHEVYDNPGADPFIQISGHNGNTEIDWIGEEEEAPAEVPLLDH